MTDTDDTAAFEAPGCRLSADALPGRVSEWRALAAQALQHRIGGGRVVSAYPNRPDIAQRLARLVAAEKDCCPFLDIDVDHGDAVINVELGYPPQFAATVTGIFSDEAQAG